MVSVTRKPTYGVGDVGRTLTTPERNTVPHVDLENPNGYEATAGRTRKSMDLD